MRQAIIWTNDGLGDRRIIASLEVVMGTGHGLTSKVRQASSERIMTHITDAFAVSKLRSKIKVTFELYGKFRCIATGLYSK